jgi:ribosomal protein S18 acetylase RimI-like enzyme
VLIREFSFPEVLNPVLKLWSSFEKGINLGRSDEPAEIEKILIRGSDLFLVAIINSEIVGTVLGGFDGRRGLIYHLAVSRPFREKGIASQLMIAIESRLKSKGCIRSYLFVTEDNPEAMQFYEKRGWERMVHVHPFAKTLE